MGSVEWLEPGDSAWARTLERLRHDVYHVPAYGALHANPLHGRIEAFVYCEGGRVLVLPLVLRATEGVIDASSPYGYPGPVATDLHHEFWRSAVRELVASLTARGVVSLFVRLHPLLPYDGEALREYGVLVRHGSTVSIDLRPPEEEIVGSFRANHRRQINRARRAGLAVAADDWSLLPQFVDAYHDTMTRVSAEAAYFFPPSYFDRLRAEVGEATHLIAAVRGQRLLAGGLFFECGGIVEYHLGATRSDALAEQPMKLVFDETCRWARRRGDTDLHLGGGVGGSVADSLFHFKAGFSNRRHPFETFRCVVDGSVYRRLSAGCGSADDADDLTGFFPAFRRKATATPTVPVVTADAVCQPPRGTREQRRTRRN